MSEFKGMEVPIGTKIEITIRTEDFGVWGANDYFYGIGIRAVIDDYRAGIFRAVITNHGIFGMSDSCEEPLRGEAVKVFIDPEKVKYAEWSGDILRIELGK